MQIITPNLLRGRIIALFWAALNLVGIGCGPTAVALVLDYILRGDMHLGAALSIVIAICGPVAIIAFRLGFKPMRDEIATMASQSNWSDQLIAQKNSLRVAVRRR